VSWLGAACIGAVTLGFWLGVWLAGRLFPDE
jgi:hypothetical protein